MRENILVLSKYTLKHCGVSGHDICNLLSNGSEKKYRKRENDKANRVKCQVLAHLVKEQAIVLCTILASFLIV